MKKIGIIGCGRLGTQISRLLLQAGLDVWALRRTKEEHETLCRMHYGDASDAATVSRLAAAECATQVLIVCANPGFRSGRGNELHTAAQYITAHFPQAAMIYTSSTSVYADAGGQSVDEQSALDTNEKSRRLVAIEEAFLRHQQTLVLRLSALSGPERDFMSRRINDAAEELQVKGPLHRWYNYIHEADAASVIALLAQRDALPVGVLNLSAPQAPTAEAYYRQLMDRAGKALRLSASSDDEPNKLVDSSSVRDLIGPRTWRGILDS